MSPARLLAGSFLLLVAFGTLGLRFVPGFYADGIPLSWVDALFTATSAVCVTGLIVVDTATHFTRLGQGFILLLIQMGGLGMITITTLIILTMGRRISLRVATVAAQVTGPVPELELRVLVRHVALLTLGLEAVGAMILYGSFRSLYPVGEAAWHAVFHAVSAFCNAGFSTFTDSLVVWSGSAPVLWTVMALITLGGIGFLTLEEVGAHLRRREGKGGRRLSLHSRFVLVGSAILLVGGWITYAAFEWTGVLAGMSGLDRLQNALFMSVTARTAGFNTVVYGDASPATNFFTILLMSVGGSPGSTAGGLKTTTFFLIGLLAWARFRGRTSVSAWSRTIPEETVQRAVGVFVLAFGTITLGIFLYAALGTAGGGSEPFLSLMFEAVSAFNTVGLSMGATLELDSAARLLTSALMFVGRIGPLSFAAALALKAQTTTHAYHFAREDVTIG
jgi:trk system potassium uptake protein TrkH